jgi:hypothetical protein
MNSFSEKCRKNNQSTSDLSGNEQMKIKGRKNTAMSNNTQTAHEFDRKSYTGMINGGGYFTRDLYSNSIQTELLSER